MSFSPVLFLHICAGAVGLLSGAAAVSFRKGSHRHRVAGNVFFISMLSMSAAGAYMAAVKSEMNNVFAGALTFYLVATAWVTARHRDRETGIFDWGALLVALAIGAGMATYGVEAARSSTGSKDGVPAVMYFVLGSVALLSATGDIRMLVRGGVSGVRRLTRHLWRMCFALFIAAGSLFLGQQQVFPAFLRKSNILFVASILPLILMVFWSIRVRLANGRKRNSLPGTGTVYSLRT